MQKQIIVPIVKKTYEPPQLIRYGEIRDMTLGGSKAGNDSGNTTDPFSLKM